MNALAKEPAATWKTDTQLDRAIEDFARKIVAGNFDKNEQEEFERIVALRREHLVELTPVKRMATMRRWLIQTGK